MNGPCDDEDKRTDRQASFPLCQSVAPQRLILRAKTLQIFPPTTTIRHAKQTSHFSHSWPEFPFLVEYNATDSSQRWNFLWYA